MGRDALNLLTSLLTCSIIHKSNTMENNMTKSVDNKILRALKKGMRVTRKTAIERGRCENLTAAISRLRQKGYVIEAVKAMTPDGDAYTRYRLVA